MAPTLLNVIGTRAVVNLGYAGTKLEVTAISIF